MLYNNKKKDFKKHQSPLHFQAVFNDTLIATREPGVRHKLCRSGKAEHKQWCHTERCAQSDAKGAKALQNPRASPLF